MAEVSKVRPNTVGFNTIGKVLREVDAYLTKIAPNADIRGNKEMLAYLPAVKAEGLTVKQLWHILQFGGIVVTTRSQFPVRDLVGKLGGNVVLVLPWGSGWDYRSEQHFDITHSLILWVSPEDVDRVVDALTD